ncbi:uncharacterized protein [Gossypium hirsutum]|uniref:Reverse transcriptase domain-containing protein n=1 Tax=Gossypium hirsutum TaxID=3635 RepID=A0A1U8KP49_GOSHI|nr:uncharacterized protein LOC107919265 [Gossypium hirsutum]
MEKSLEREIKTSWESSTGTILEKMEILQSKLKKWAESITKERKGIKKRLTKKLELLMEEERNDDTMTKIIDTKVHLNKEINRDEIYWEQRARANWLKAGDKNSSYFHKHDSFRRKNNTIARIELDGGREATDERMISIKKTISSDLNEELTSKFTEEEVFSALKGMGPTKAPRPDGFPTLFYQRYWHIVGRLISDNVLLAYEILHTFQQKQTGNKGYMAVKLDMSKAYDRVEWSFLKEVMLRMGFAKEWVDLIMKCINLATYAVNTNGRRGRIFKSSRGLLQGDPLSPFLFLLYSEGLSTLMRLAMKEGLLKGAKASRKGPEISQLLFADDCILFGEATDSGVRMLKGILKEFEECSGQCVNFDKSTVFFSTNTLVEKRGEVSTSLGVGGSTDMEK